MRQISLHHLCVHDNIFIYGSFWLIVIFKISFMLNCYILSREHTMHLSLDPSPLEEYKTHHGCYEDCIITLHDII